jgi:Tfp pilus assembly protein PilO
VSNNRLWIIGTALLVVATVALGWLLGISPQLKEAAKAASDTAAVDAQNVVNNAELERLKKQFAQIDDIRAEVDELNVSVPPTLDITSFLRQIDALATEHGVTVQGVTPTDAATFVPSEDEAAAETETPAPVPPADDPAALAAEAVAAATANVADGQLITVGISVVVTGTYDQVLAFTRGLQLGDRLFMASDVTVVSKAGDTATGGAATGEYEGNVAGLIYVLP